MKSRSIVAVAVLMLAMSVMGSPSPAQAGPADEIAGANFCMPPIGRLIAGNIGRLLVLKSELNVTDEQKRKIAATVKSHRDEIRPVAQTVIEKRKALREAVMAQPANDQAIRAAATDLGKAIGDAAVVASKVIGEARGALKPDQIERIQKFRASCDDSVADWVKTIGQ